MAKVKKDRSEFYPHEIKGQKSPIVPIIEVAEMVEARAHIIDPDKKPFKFLTWTGQTVRCGIIDVNYEIQRGADPAWIEDNIYSQWKPSHATPAIGVRKSNTSRIRIVDGQQHILAFLLSIPPHKRANARIPMNVVTSKNPNTERNLFYAANEESKDISPYKKFTSKLGMNDPDIIKINRAVERAGFFVAHLGIRKRRAITHIQNLLKAGTEYGPRELTYVLKKMGARWPKELNLSTPLLLGLLESRRQLKKANILTDDLFNNIMLALHKYYDTGAQVWQDCNNAFSLARPDESQSLAKKVFSGIIYLHNITFPKQTINLDISQEYDIPLMPDEFKLHKRFNKKTYQTYDVFVQICATGDLRIAWARARASKYKVTPEQLYQLCVEADKCPAHGCKSTEFDYALGDNIKNKKLSVNTPSVDHIDPKSKGGKDELNNYQITCENCNTMLNSQTPADHTKTGSLHIPAGTPAAERKIIIESMKESEALLLAAKKKYAKGSTAQSA